MRRWLIGLAAVVLLAAASVLGAAIDRGMRSSDSRHEVLVMAEHVECSAEWERVYGYLATGDAHAYRDVAREYRAQREAIMRAPRATRAGLVDTAASVAATRCDQEVDHREMHDPRQPPRDPAGDAVRSARYAATCGAHHGTLLATGVCVVRYPPSRDSLVLPIDGDGTWDERRVDADQLACGSYAEAASASARQGRPWPVPPEFHPDTGVCAPGRPL